MSAIEDKIRKMGFTLPAPFTGHGRDLPALPGVKHSGKVGKEVTIEEGYATSTTQPVRLGFGNYLWESVAAAHAFYTADWVAMVTERWAGAPQRQEWETPMVVESAERRLVAAE